MHQAGGQAEQPLLPRAPRLQQADLRPAKIKDVPGQKAKDHKGQPQMHRQPVGCDIDAATTKAR